MFEFFKEIGQNKDSNDSQWYRNYFKIIHKDHQNIKGINQYPNCELKVENTVALLFRFMEKREKQHKYAIEIEKQEHLLTLESFQEKYQEIQYWIVLESIKCEIYGMTDYRLF